MSQWDFSCPDWADRLRDGRSLVPGLPLLDRQEALRAIAVFNRLRLPDVEGTPTMAEAAGDWFRDIVGALFGSVDAATGRRMVRELFCLVPKKNSKTSNGALLMLSALLLNTTPRGKFIMTGPTQDVAELAFSQAKGAIELDPVLSAKLQIRDHLKTIVHRASGAELEIMTFDPSVLTGQKPAGILIDELHVSAKMSKAASALRQLRGGMISNKKSFLVIITTQSEEAPVGIFRAELMKARAIRDGRRNGAMLPVLYEFPEAIQKNQEAWRDPANWPMVTPNADRSITIDRLKEEFETAEATGTDELRAWASQHLNIEIGLALHTDRWGGAEYWEKRAEVGLTLPEMLRRCEVITVGLDGGGMDDLLGLCLLGRERETGRLLVWVRAFVHQIALDRRKSEAARLLDFAEQGDLIIITKPGTHVPRAVDIIEQVRDAGLLGGVGLDSYDIKEIVEELTARGIGGESQFGDQMAPMVQGIPQSWKMSGAIKSAELALASGKMVHAGQDLMAWCISNVKIEPRGNALSATKQAAGTAKIDPFVAMLDALELMGRDPQLSVRSVYEERGIRLF